MGDYDFKFEEPEQWKEYSCIPPVYKSLSDGAKLVYYVGHVVSKTIFFKIDTLVTLTARPGFDEMLKHYTYPKPSEAIIKVVDHG